MLPLVAVIVLDPALVSVTSPVQTPSSVNWTSAMDAGSIVPSSTDKAVAPETSVVVLPSESFAVIVTEKATPAVPDAGASTSKLANTPAFTVKVPVSSVCPLPSSARKTPVPVLFGETVVLVPVFVVKSSLLNAPEAQDQVTETSCL